MKTELIPLLQITNRGLNLEWPKQGTSLDHPDEWYDYYQRTNSAAGFTDHLSPYRKGLEFYFLHEVSNANLLLLMKRELAELKEMLDENPELGPTACVLQGGYLLRVGGQDILFPQCCCDLTDIQTWQDLATGTRNDLYAGHPTPIITVEGDLLHFDFTCSPSGEGFFPPSPVPAIRMERQELLKAVAETSIILEAFARRLESVAWQAGLPVQNIAQMFIYDFVPGEE